MVISLFAALLVVSGCDYYTDSTIISQSHLTMLAKLVSEFSVSTTWCVGVPMFFRSVQTKQHEHAKYLSRDLVSALEYHS